MNSPIVVYLIRLGIANTGSEHRQPLISLVKRNKFPKLRILAISRFDEMIYPERVLRAGRPRVWDERRITTEIFAAIRAVLDGELYAGSKPAAIALHNDRKKI